MAALVVTWLPVVLWLLPGVLMQQTYAQQTPKSPTITADCPCQKALAGELDKDHLGDDTVSVGMKRKISCCKNQLLDHPDNGTSIQWSFNGEAYSDKWSSSFKFRYCGNETITTTFATNADSGNYSCTLTTTNGTSKTVSMKLTVQGYMDFRDMPKAGKSSTDTLAMTGDSVTLECEAYVGENTISASVLWFYYGPNGNQSFAKYLPNVNVTQVRVSNGSRGMMKGQLVISAVEKIHFGIYQCKIKNGHGAVLLNTTLTEGIPEDKATMLRYKTTMVVVASLLGLLAVLLVVWCRCGRLLCLYFCHRTAASDDHQYDVFLVHGESASRWIWSVLLPALEDSFGYTCFLPQRDMCGGEMVAESILEALTKCRRVVVVMTPCLLKSSWATWATYSGIHAALSSKARILALVHKEQSFMSGSPDQNPFLSVLKVVRKIRVPENFPLAVDEDERSLQLADTTKPQIDNQKMELKLMIPEINITTTGSNSPHKSQRLSNMITGSNAASREDLDCEKEKTTQAGGPIVFTGEDHGLQDPGSPSSVTPFILPSSCKPCQSSNNGSVCKSVGWCLRMMCTGDPKEQFWQTLRLRLGPPSSGRHRSTDK